MGRNKHLRDVLASLEQNINEHERKINLERAKPIPDEGLITKWEKDRAGFEKRRGRLLRRLRRDW